MTDGGLLLPWVYTTSLTKVTLFTIERISIISSAILPNEVDVRCFFCTCFTLRVSHYEFDDNLEAHFLDLQIPCFCIFRYLTDVDLYLLSFCH